MSLINLKDMLSEAAKDKVAVPMFNVLDTHMLQGILQAAETAGSPVILAMAEVHLPYTGLELLGPMLIAEAKRAKVPVCVHLDHGTDEEVIRQALEIGFTSIMYDGSILDYEANVAYTKRAVELARRYGASVEAEIGHVAGGEGGTEDPHDAVYTDPEQAAEFAERTGVDALAVAIGTVHGPYRAEPKLDLKRLEKIHELVDVPLVLHGGSGLSDQDFLACIERGIAKINICTDLFAAGLRGMEAGLAERLSYPEVNRLAEEAIAEEALKKIKLFMRTEQVVQA